MNVDLPFKLAMHDPVMAPEIAGLLLGEKVASVNRLQTNYTRTIVEMHADNVFDVVLASGKNCILHTEVQGKGSHRPMGMRVFDYISRILSQRNSLNMPIKSVVIYVGEGAGAKDDGRWYIGEPAIGFFQYRVIRLWQYSAAEWLAMDNPVLLPLIAHTQMEAPEEQLQAAMERINQLDNKEDVANLLYILGALLEKEGLRHMVDLFITRHEIMESPPIIRDFYLKGEKEGIEQGLATGRKEGLLEAKVNATLELLEHNIILPKYDYDAIKTALSTMDKSTVDVAFRQAIKTKQLADFKGWLETLPSATEPSAQES